MFSRSSKSSWTVDTLHEHFIALLQEHEKAVKAALASSETAINKSEHNVEKWRDNANEWRQAMDDREVKFLPRTEYYTAHQSLVERVGSLETRVIRNEATGAGLKQGWSFFVAGVGLLLALLGIVSYLKH
jgi:hypothetical protein